MLATFILLAERDSGFNRSYFQVIFFSLFRCKVVLPSSSLDPSFFQETLKNTNLYVSSIPEAHSSEEGLKSLFEEFGKIINLKV